MMDKVPMRTAIAIAVVKSRREQAAKIKALRLRTEAAEAEAEQLRSSNHAMVRVLQRCLLSGMRPPEEAVADAKLLSSIEEGHMLEAVLRVCGVKVAPGTQLLPEEPLGEANKEQIIRHGMAVLMEQHAREAQHHLSSAEELQQRSAGLASLLEGMHVLQGIVAHTLPRKQHVSHRTPDTPQRPCHGSQPVRVVLGFMTRVLAHLAPSSLRDAYMEISVDMLTALMLQASGLEHEISVKRQGPSYKGDAAIELQVLPAVEDLVARCCEGQSMSGGPEHLRSDAVQALLHSMVQRSSQLGLLVLLSTCGSIQAACSGMLDACKLCPVAATRAERASHLAKAAAFFHKSHTSFHLLDLCVDALPRWCATSIITARTSENESILSISAHALADAFGMMPKLHGLAPLVSKALARSMAAFASCLQHIAAHPEFSNCPHRADCRKICIILRDAMGPNNMMQLASGMTDTG
eukprot:238029-Chlamydomonas_euryale.AAC.11